MKIIERTFDAITGETTEVERAMTSDELALYKADLAKAEIEAQTQATKAMEKSALLAKLGITEDEAKLLLS